MFLFGGGKPPPPKIEKQNSADPGLPGSNPFDSDVKPKHGRTTSDPVAIKGKLPDDDDDWTGTYSSSVQNKYKNDFRDSGGFENQSVQELQNYAAYKAEETTDTVNNCLRIAEDIKGEAERTLVTLHQQGEQIGRTHVAVVNMEQDLSRGEKLLGSLGGMFSMPWNPKKNRDIKGPVDVADNSSKKNDKDSEKRENLGLSNNSKGNRQYAKPTSAMEKVEIERAKQDDGLNDLSDVLGQLKGMAVDMGSELERQNKALDHLNDDIDEMNERVKGANQRARRIVGK